MTNINQQILTSLIKAKSQLSNEALESIKSFINSQKHAKGGFINRSGKTDPYYSIFGLTLSYVFNVPVDYKHEVEFLNKWKQNNSIDFIHAISILQCSYLLEAIKLSQKFEHIASALSKSWIIQQSIGFQLAKRIRKNYKDLLLLVANHKSESGGYHHVNEQTSSSVYANFLVYCLFEDLHFSRLWRKTIAKSCLNLQLADGSFVNHPESKEGITSNTAAALMLIHQENFEDDMASKWLKSMQITNGGFLAGKQVPIADTLSTATALFALKSANKSNGIQITKAIEFVNLHWSENGGFFGSIADQHPDIEYTFYALLAIGQAS